MVTEALSTQTCTGRELHVQTQKLHERADIVVKKKLL